MLCEGETNVLPRRCGDDGEPIDQVHTIPEDNINI